MLDQTTKATLDLLKTAFANPMELNPTDVLAKIFTQATGLVYYDLQAPALRIYPVITPLRNEIPRVGGGAGEATHWKAILGINIAGLSPGVGEGNRGGIIATNTVSRVAAYKTLGYEDFATWQADWAAKGFDDVKAVAVEGTLRSLMIGEEKTDWGGNASLPLGITPTPNVVASNADGALATAVYSVICVALTPEGYYNSSIAGGIPGQINRTNADGSIETYGGGNAQRSVAGSGEVTAGDAGSLACTVAPVNGAAAYAWFVGAAGSEKLVQITTINSALITSVAEGVRTLGVAADDDYSTNQLVYDGLLTQICLPGSTSYSYAMPTGTPGTGTGFTSDGGAGIVEINTAFRWFWDNYRLSPEVIWASAQELVNMNEIIIKNGGAPLIRFNMDAQGAHTIDAGVVVGSMLNKITNTKVELRVHPNAVPGTIVFYSRRVPYPLSNVGSLIMKRTRVDYFQVDWPRNRPRYEYGCYMDGLLQLYFPPAYGVITNIANRV